MLIFGKRVWGFANMVFHRVLRLAGLIVILATIDIISLSQPIQKICFCDKAIINWKAEFLSVTERLPKAMLRLQFDTKPQVDVSKVIESISLALAKANSCEFLQNMCIRSIAPGVIQLILVSIPQVQLSVRSTSKNKVILHVVKNMDQEMYQRKIYV